VLRKAALVDVEDDIEADVTVAVEGHLPPLRGVLVDDRVELGGAVVHG